MKVRNVERISITRDCSGLSGRLQNADRLWIAMQVVIGAVLTFLIVGTVTLPSYPAIRVSRFPPKSPVMVMPYDCSHLVLRHRCTARSSEEQVGARQRQAASILVFSISLPPPLTRQHSSVLTSTKRTTVVTRVVNLVHTLVPAPFSSTVVSIALGTSSI